jgi:hypothetical protein
MGRSLPPPLCIVPITVIGHRNSKMERLLSETSAQSRRTALPHGDSRLMRPDCCEFLQFQVKR